MSETYGLRARFDVKVSDQEEAERLADQIAEMIKKIPQCSDVQVFVFDDPDLGKGLDEYVAELETWFRQEYAREIARVEQESDVLASLVDECFGDDAERHNEGGLTMQFEYLWDYYGGVEDTKTGINEYFLRS